MLTRTEAPHEEQRLNLYHSSPGNTKWGSGLMGLPFVQVQEGDIGRQAPIAPRRSAPVRRPARGSPPPSPCPAGPCPRSWAGTQRIGRPSRCRRAFPQGHSHEPIEGNVAMASNSTKLKNTNNNQGFPLFRDFSWSHSWFFECEKNCPVWSLVQLLTLFNWVSFLFILLYSLLLFILLLFIVTSYLLILVCNNFLVKRCLMPQIFFIFWPVARCQLKDLNWNMSFFVLGTTF